MVRWIKDLDRILRGEATRLSALSTGRLEIRAGGLLVLLILLGMVYGLCMGCYAITADRAGEWRQMLAAMGKVPALFLFTLLVTFPSLYVFNALVGSRLTFTSVLRLLIAALSVMLTVLASFGTIVAFFSFTTTSYSFMVLLNVLVFAISGFLGLTFLLRTMHRLTIVQDETPTAPIAEVATAEVVEPPTPASTTLGTESAQSPDDLERVRDFVESRRRRADGALEPIAGRNVTRDVRTVFRLWIIIFGLVGAQMSWVLRPFIGGGKEFVLFRPRGGNFFQAVFSQLGNLLGGW